MKKLYIIKLGLAFTLLYAGIDSFLHTFDWIGFVPTWTTAVFHISRTLALHAHSTAEIILGLWLLTPWANRTAAWLTALDILVIIFANGFSRAVFTTTFRDVGLFTAAVYLAIASEKRMMPV